MTKVLVGLGYSTAISCS